MIYLIVAILILFLSFRYDICEKTKGRNECYLVILIIFIFIAGLRWRVGGDTTRYLDSFYNRTPLLWEIDMEDLSLGGKPLWGLLLSFIYTIGGRFFWIQFIESAFVNILLFKYIRKHCQYIFTCVFFYFISEYFYFNTEIMKAAFCIVICLYANDYMIERKWLKSYILIAVAALFHPQALIMVINPLFLFLRINKIGLLFLFLSFFAGYIIQISIGDYLVMFDSIEDEDIGDKLTAYGSSGYAESRSFFNQIMNTYPLIVYSIVCVFVYKTRSTQKILYLQSFLILGLAYQILSLQVYIFYRIAQAFIIYPLFFITYVVVEMIKDNKKLRLSLSCIRTIILFFPLVFSLLFNNNISKRRVKYYPYTSIINRRIVKERELFVHDEQMASFSIANVNQY